MTLSMEDYFEGERSASFVFFGHGLTSIGTSVFLFTRKDDMSRGAAYPPVIVGALEATVGLALMIRTSKQIAERRQLIASHPEKFRQDEQKRMRRVIRQFVALEGIEIGTIATGIGLLTAGEITQKPTMTGVGISLAVQGSSLLGLDFLAERRGQRIPASHCRLSTLRRACVSDIRRGSSNRPPGPTNPGGQLPLSPIDSQRPASPSSEATNPSTRCSYPSRSGNGTTTAPPCCYPPSMPPKPYLPPGSSYPLR
jgi:hypothetical protein